jgi:hypothetical protein
MVLQREIVVDRLPVIYRAIESITVGKYICPVPRCGGKASTKWNFRRHFLDRHPQDLVYLPSDGTVPLPRCKRFGMQMERGALLGWHQRTQLCREGWDKKVQHEATKTARVALTQSFTAYGDKLEKGGGVQISGLVAGLRRQRYPGYAREPEEGAQELGSGLLYFEGRERFT